MGARRLRYGLASFAPDAEWRTAEDEPDSQTHRGIDALTRLSTGFAEPWTNRFGEAMELGELVACGPWVLVPWRARLYGRGSGVDVEVVETYAVLVRDGAIRRVEEYRTTDAALEAKDPGRAARHGPGGQRARRDPGGAGGGGMTL